MKDKRKNELPGAAALKGDRDRSSPGAFSQDDHLPHPLLPGKQDDHQLKQKEWTRINMENLFEAPRLEEVKQRLARLKPDSERQWGSMELATMLAHCTAGIKMAVGEVPSSPRLLIGRLLGPIAKRSLLVKGEPMRRNSTTDKNVLVTGKFDFETERQRLLKTIDRFATDGPAICTRDPHFFFGRLTAVEWAALVYRHLDHHLRQFGA